MKSAFCSVAVTCSAACGRRLRLGLVKLVLKERCLFHPQLFQSGSSSCDGMLRKDSTITATCCRHKKPVWSLGGACVASRGGGIYATPQERQNFYPGRSEGSCVEEYSGPIRRIHERNSPAPAEGSSLCFSSTDSTDSTDIAGPAASLDLVAWWVDRFLKPPGSDLDAT